MTRLCLTKQVILMILNKSGLLIKRSGSKFNHDLLLEAPGKGQQTTWTVLPLPEMSPILRYKGVATTTVLTVHYATSRARLSIE